MRPTWAEISLPTLRQNFRAIQNTVGNGVTVCAVVKADAYGHGAAECARALETEGAQWLGVTSTEEGVHLRKAGIGTRILLMTGFWRGEEEEVIQHNLTPALSDWWQIGFLEAALEKLGRKERFPVHLKVDTGMSRLGVQRNYLDKFAQRALSVAALETEGLMSHIASAEALDASDAAAQLESFAKAVEDLRAVGAAPKYLHLANSAAIFARPDTRFNFVRPGISLYGYSLPYSGSTPPEVPVQPVLSWKSRIAFVREIAEGQGVGYNITWAAPRKSRIGVLPVGYADGVDRRLSSRGRVIVRDQYAPIVGRVSMDLTIVDLTDIPDSNLGDEAILIGSSEHCRVTAWDHAEWAGTIPYEILCGISKRVRREYVE